VEYSEVSSRVLLADLPDVLTIEEAAAVLRIGRGAAYQLAHRFLWSGGVEGLPVFQLGRRLRVPKAALERLMNAAPRAGELQVVRHADRPKRLWSG
jgi:excisionase family DNA binding protein